ncbi:hypothetical protein Misp03_15270 [Microbispora sp. NBRC 16548]|nr:hypothetical protein Misp03_15270 [Microbispora sp. NBRC 16548]
MSFDRGDGIDYGRVAYARRPSGEPVFEEPEIFEIGIRPRTDVPKVDQVLTGARTMTRSRTGARQLDGLHAP